MKKIFKISLMCMLFLGIVLRFSGDEVQAASDLEKAKIVTVKQTDKKTVKVTWDKVSGAKGYSLQYRVSGGSWKTQSTTKTKLTVSDLKVNTIYQFRVRAYRIINGKKEYGNYSAIKKINVQDYKVSKTSILSITQIGKKKVKITWDKVPNVKGYSVQYKVADGSWKTLNTKKTHITISNLEASKKYQFRIRAYKIINNKKYYGKYSVIKKITVKDYVYLVEKYDPYNSEYYTAYKNGDYFYMGGKKQKNSFTLGQASWGVDKTANFNIEGKYKKISFKVGKVDDAPNHPYDGDLDVNIYSDGTLIETIVVNVEDLPQKVSIELDNTERLTFEVETDACTIVGFSDIKLFYK